MKFNEVYLRPVSPCLFVLVPHLKATDGNQKEIQQKKMGDQCWISGTSLSQLFNKFNSSLKKKSSANSSNLQVLLNIWIHPELHFA